MNCCDISGNTFHSQPNRSTRATCNELRRIQTATKKRKTKPTGTAKLPHPWALFLTFFLYSPCSCEHLSQLLIEWRQPFKQHLYYNTFAIEKQIIHTENNSILCRISTTFVEFCQRALIFNFYRPYIPKQPLQNRHCYTDYPNLQVDSLLRN